ncbi:MAG: hypothetical protein P8181_13950, partial [bacterium]
VNPAGGTLGSGEIQTTFSDEKAETVRVHVESLLNPGIQGNSPLITVHPDVAYEQITATPVPNTITANGTSKSVVTSDPIEDRYQNVVASNTMITVSTDAGSIDPLFDQDAGTPGIQRATDANGQISFEVKSGTSPATATVSLDAVAPGTASGTTSIVFAPEPNIVAGNPVPATVSPGESVQFVVQVQNTTSTAATLDTNTQFYFSDGEQDFLANLSQSKLVPGSGSATLTFDTTKIDNQMDSRQYRPEILLSGTDEYGSGIDGSVPLAPNSLNVTAIRITGIVPESSVISQGQTKDITVSVHNDGELTANIESVNFKFTVGTYTYDPIVSPPLAISAKTTRSVSVPVTVASNSETGTSTIDAVVTGSVGGETVTDTTLGPPLPEWTITQSADVRYVQGTIAPDSVSRGRTHGLSVKLLNNSSGSTVTVRSTSRIEFTDGSATYSANLTQDEAFGPKASRVVDFVPTTVPIAIKADRTYDVTLYIDGLDNDVPFQDTLHTADVGDLLTVLRPADVTYNPGSLNPQQVSQGISQWFEIGVINSGSAEVHLTPGSTTLSFGPGYTATLDPNYETVIAGDDTTPLRFIPQTVGVPIGSYFPSVQLVGTENTLGFNRPLTPNPITDSVTVQQAADIVIQGIASDPTTMSAACWTVTLSVIGFGVSGRLNPSVFSVPTS